MNTLKAKKTISCDLCGCSLNRTKSIKVESSTREAAIEEGRQKFEIWVKSLAGQQCKICREISRDLG